ncbi:hypothetical protein PIB30_025003 [Stylosanthes scabra]|uniref:F-box domain-containing protein n=1 Tax=Stylosanthes scabra TaxID=79078 RepID=A0ABU6Z7K2_9FABA|nr:hypothetical protein [Stylosanthes scabra]
MGNLLGTTDKRPKPSPPILPDDLIEEILVRVPASTLLRLKIVCKSWNALICSSEFTRFHLDRSREDPPLVYGFEYDRKIRFVPMRNVLPGVHARCHVGMVSRDKLGSKNSRKSIVQDSPCYYEPKAVIGTFVNGSLNWAAHAHAESYNGDPGVDALRDRLCVCLMMEKHNGWVLWVMEEYGVEESWTRLFNVVSEIQGHRGPFKALYTTQDNAAYVTVFSPGNRSYGLKIVTHEKYVALGWNIYYRVEVGHQNMYVYHETLLSPSHLGLPSFNYTD